MIAFQYIASLALAIACPVIMTRALSRQASMLRRVWIAVVLGAVIYSVVFISIEAVPSMSFFRLVKSGDITGVKELISRRPLLVHSETSFGRDTGLQIAARSGNAVMVKLLLNAGADVNARNHEGFTPLHEAAFNGNDSIAEILLNSGADVNAFGGKYRSAPLHIAASQGHVAVVKLLLEHGASLKMLDRKSQTPLELAISNHQTNVVTIFTNSSF